MGDGMDWNEICDVLESKKDWEAETCWAQSTYTAGSPGPPQVLDRYTLSSYFVPE